MEIAKLNATPRETSGKGAARKLRRDGQIPAVAYGKDLKSTPLSVSPKELSEILLSSWGQNSLIELAVGSDKFNAMVKDYTYHPISRELVHADFIKVDMAKPVDVKVPFKTKGRSKGVVAGGRMQRAFREIPMKCLPDRIPAVIEVDITNLDLNGTIKVADLQLQEGTSAKLPAEQTLVIIHSPDKKAAEKDEEEEAKA